MEGGGGRKRKAGIQQLNWDSLLGDSGEPLPEVVIQAAAAEISIPSVVGIAKKEDESDMDHYLRQLSDKVLREKIARAKSFLGKGKLIDGGEKLRGNLKKQEAELERRARMKDDSKCKVVITLADESTCKGPTDDLSTHGAPPPLPTSEFAMRFCSKLEDEKATKCFGEELSTLNHSDCKNMREHVPFSAQSGKKRALSSRLAPFKSPGHLSVNIDSPHQSNGEQRRNHSSNPSPHQSDKDASGCSAKKERAPNHHQHPFNTRRNTRKTVVLVDEEDLEDDVIIADDQVGLSKENRIYYPSRDDPEAIEICYSDMECLAPESYLSSSIMNFYIRYLQKPKSPRAKSGCDYHFFNTYFYNKLKEDVLTKKGSDERGSNLMQADKESYLKFRRWWKGVNIFQKAYIFLPIHENLHWSLVIICIPNKEDESGPVILHLDSLGMHFSKSIFSNVKSFLIEEWKYLRQEEVLPELPIADNIWGKLSRNIVERVIEVPQQKNEYDCGIFVLFFMERFIDEAPQRLRKEDLEMFGRQWFRPEEASSLRRKIRNLLNKEFKNANKGTSKLDA